MQSKPYSAAIALLICSIGPRMVVNINQNITGEESFPRKGSVLLVPSYLQST